MKNLTDFRLCYQNYVAIFEEYLEKYAKSLQTSPSVLGESIKYSLLSGGKRIRPVLTLACAEVLGVSSQEVLPFALAIEMIHTYSLIHDDLPAMDDDDFRRGQPSNHKQFGEATAILAGDALLNEAYAVCLNECGKGEMQLLAAQYVNECAGAFGMIAGQCADLAFEKGKQEGTEDDLMYVYAHKTGKLLLAPIMIACILSGRKNYLQFERFGKQLGVLFQMTDDILDVEGEFQSLGKSIGKDAESEKLTCVRIYGLSGAKLRAEICARECRALLETIDGNTAFLSGLIDYVLERCE